MIPKAGHTLLISLVLVLAFVLPGCRSVTFDPSYGLDTQSAMRFERARRNWRAVGELAAEDPERARRLNLVRDDVEFILAARPDLFPAERLYQDVLRAADPEAARARYLPDPLPDTAAGLTAAARMYLPDEPATAEDLLQRAVEADPRFAWAHYGLGFLRNRDGRLEEALGNLDDALDRDPVLEEALSLKAVVLEASGRLEEASPVYDRLLEMWPEGDSHLRYLYRQAHLWVQTDSEDDADRAEDQLRQVLADLPRPTVGEWRALERNALQDIGVALWVQGKKEQALAAWDHLINLEPRLLYAHYNRGFLLEDLGRYEQALAAYERFQKLAEASREDRAMDQLLDEVFNVPVNIQRLKNKIAAQQAAREDAGS